MSTFSDTNQLAKRDKRMTVNLSADEETFIKSIVNARIEKGLSKDTAHFIRQCFQFIIEREYLEGYEFWIPETTAPQSSIDPAKPPVNE